MWPLALAALLVAPLLPPVAARVEYCATNTFATNSSYLQFTKEPIGAEYAVQNKFKAIHCCGKGYRSIEWFKDGAAYPWASAVSNLILYPEAANQTLYTQRAGRADSGNYTCRMRNETHHRDHTVELQVAELPPDTPRATVTPTDKWVELGDEVRLYCEAFVGRVSLADAHSDIRWRLVRPGEDQEDGKENETLNFKEIQTKRENEDILGAYLCIGSMRPEHYGQYVCTVRSNDVVSEMPVTLHYIAGAGAAGAGEAHTAPGWRALLLGALLAGAALLALAAFYVRCWPRLALAARILHARRSRTSHVSDKEYDVLVVCTRVDGELTRGALLPTLALKYHYRLSHLQLSTDPDTWYEQCVERAGACRALLCVLSPAQHSPPQLLTALKQLRALPLPPVIVLLQDLPKLKREAKDERGESLVSLLRKTKLLAWRHVQDRAFWTSLRLALPLPPPPPHAASPAAAAALTDPSRPSRPSDRTALANKKMKHKDVTLVELTRKSREASRSGSLDALV